MRRRQSFRREMYDTDERVNPNEGRAPAAKQSNVMIRQMKHIRVVMESEPYLEIWRPTATKTCRPYTGGRMMQKEYLFRIRKFFLSIFAFKYFFPNYEVMSK